MDDTDSPDDFVDPDTDISNNSIYKAIWQELEDEEAKKRTPKEQAEDHATRRNNHAETQEEAKIAMRDLITKYALKPVTDKALEECWRLDHDVRGVKADKPFLQSLGGKLSSLPNTWTSFMRSFVHL